VGTSGADCTFNYAATGDALQQALGDADTTIDIGGTPDTVRIGPGTYLQTSGAGFHSTGGDLSIVGAGESTVLTTDATDNRIVLGVPQSGPPTSGEAVRRLRVDLAGKSVGIAYFRNVSDVHVAGPGSAIDGIVMPAGGRLTRATVEPGAHSTAIAATGGVIEDVVVRLRAPSNAVGVINDAVPVTTETIRHLTVDGAGAAGNTGVAAGASGTSSDARTLNVSLRDSVLHGLETPVFRNGFSANSAHPGTANVEYRYSSLNAAANTALGNGTFTQGPGDLNDPDPMFAADLSLLAGSPLIDAGDPAAPDAGDSATDAAGNPRIFGARRDIGAFEYQHASSPPPPPPPPAGGAPVISSLTQSAKKWREPKDPGLATVTRKKKKIPVGTTFSYSLDKLASVSASFTQSRPGRMVAGKCVARKKTNRKKRKCKRTIAAGRLRFAGHAGVNKVHFRGRITRTRKLKPGKYSVAFRATTAGGLTSTPKTLTFTIVK
jgi:hypothetical protein